MVRCESRTWLTACELASRHEKLEERISVSDSNQMKLFDAGLACQNMQIAARALGYGSKIETSPTRMIRNDDTDEWNRRLGIPDGKIAVAALFIGRKVDGADAVSSASTRYSFDELVQFIE